MADRPANTPDAPRIGCIQPRARGSASLSVKARGNTSVLNSLRHSGSLKLLFPRPHQPALEAVMINTAGGVTGGDRFDLTATAAAGTELTLTTQAAERAYRAQPGETGRIRTHLVVGDGARANWLPQETILFQGCRLDRHLQIDLEASSRLLMCEALVFGRAAMGERLTDGVMQDRIDIRRCDQPLFQDAMTFCGDIAAHLAKPTVAAGAGALATVIFVAPDAEGRLAPLRRMLGSTAGASLIGSDLLILRALAPDSYALRKVLMPILTDLLAAPLPKPWMT